MTPSTHRTLVHVVWVPFMIGALLALIVATWSVGPASGARRRPRTSTTTSPVPMVPAPRPVGKLVPPRGALLGAFVSSTGTGWTADDVTARETQLGRTFDIDHRFQNWTTHFPTPADGWDVQNGRIPMVTWQPDTTNLDTINVGANDDLIRARAHDVATFGQPMFLRFAHEMNADWYPWDGVNNNTAGRHDGPAKYIVAWRHVHDLFVAAGATNAVWVWCPNRTSLPNAAWNRAQNYYPGDAYVDWVCIDGYNRDAMHWRSFTTLFSTVSAASAAYAARKPIMIGETSSVEGGAAKKAAWIDDAAVAMQQRFPSIAAFVWFDTQKNGFDFRIDSSASSFQAFRSLALSSYFRTRA